MTKKLLVTGSSGLIGSEVCVYLAKELGYTIPGVDNNQRAVFFGHQVRDCSHLSDLNSLIFSQITSNRSL